VKLSTLAYPAPLTRAPIPTWVAEVRALRRVLDLAPQTRSAFPPLVVTLVVICVIVLGSGLLSGCSRDAPVILANETEAPDFILTSLNANEISLSNLRGHVVAVRFWADWCPFCRREMRELNPVAERLADAGVVLLAINTGQDRARVERFVERLGLSYPILLDPDSQVSRRYGVIAIPVTYFIDREGIVRGRILGESDAATFERMLSPLL